MNKKVAIIGTVGIPAKYGGFETLTEYLTKHLSEKFDFTVFCSAKEYNEKLKEYNGAKLKYIDFKANGVQSIIYDIISIFKSIGKNDTLLILGVSGCIVLPIVRLVSKEKIVVNIDGLEWKRDKWKWYAKKFLKFSEKVAVKNADVVISDNRVIQRYVKEEYGKDSVYISYGGDHVKKLPLSNDLVEKFPFLKEKYAFTVCRIEPENNIHLILEAFKEYKDLNLVIIGNWQSSEYGKKLFEKYSNNENIFLLNPIYDQNILNQIRSNCYVYLHGHSAGGTNPSLVEAMHLELPIIAFGVEYNKETTDYQARYFDNVQKLIEIISDVDENELMRIGKKMKEIANRNFTWEKVCNSYAEVF